MIAGMKKVCIIFSMGCPRQEADVACLFSYFPANGWRIVETVREADLVIYSGCGVSDSMEARSLKLLSLVKGRMRSDARLIVVGCLATTAAASITSRYFGSTCLPARLLASLDGLVAERVKLQDLPEPNELEPLIAQAGRPFSWLDRKRAGFSREKVRTLNFRRFFGGMAAPSRKREATFSIRVAWGCKGTCSYCAIRLGMEEFRSKPLDRVFAEMRRGRALEYRRFQTVAADVGAYGQDCGSNFSELLHGLLGQQGEYVVSIPDINVQWLIESPQAVAALAAGASRVANLQVPVQSGSDRILKRMNRPYCCADATRVLREVRAVCPGASCITHVIVGFPGESEDDFAQTVAMLRQLPGYRFNVYKYSDRPGTEALGFPDKVSEPEKFRRIGRLQDAFGSRCKIMI